MVAFETYKSPLRYPGGKQKDLPFLSKFISNCKEFREPFLGGGSVLLYAVKNSLADSYWGNDLNEALYKFWQQIKTDADELADGARQFKIQHEYRGETKNCSEWQKFRKQIIKNLNELSNTPLEEAVRFFILNRSTSGGSTESGGLTPASYCERFTLSSIETVRKLKGVLGEVKFTNKDYEELLIAPGEDVFIFLDPPYLSASRSGLYGKSGDLHRTFDHERLAKALWHCPHKWLMTIDNCQEIRDLYHWAETLPWSKAYGMTNSGGQKSKRGDELLVANFPLSSDEIGNCQVSLEIEPQKLTGHPLYEKIYKSQDQNELEKLVRSMKKWGFYFRKPIVVNPKMQIISGNKRKDAAIICEFAKVPICILNLDEKETIEMLIKENRCKDKTNYQRAVEYSFLSSISHRNDLNILAQSSANEPVQLSINLPNSNRSKIRDIIGRQVGWAGRTADKARRAVNVIDLLQSSNNPEDLELAEQGLKALNENPSSGYKFATEILKQRPELKKRLNNERLGYKKSNQTLSELDGILK